jgi:hypothetical protein
VTLDQRVIEPAAGERRWDGSEVEREVNLSFGTGIKRNRPPLQRLTPKLRGDLVGAGAVRHMVQEDQTKSDLVLMPETRRPAGEGINRLPAECGRPLQPRMSDATLVEKPGDRRGRQQGRPRHLPTTADAGTS